MNESVELENLVCEAKYVTVFLTQMSNKLL